MLYTVVMTHAWLNHAAMGTYRDFYEEYFWIANPQKFDWSWHLGDFVVGARAALKKMGATAKTVGVSRLSGVEIPLGDKQHETVPELVLSPQSQPAHNSA